MTVADASSKIPDGILYGSVSSFGNYDECLDSVAFDDPLKSGTLDNEEKSTDKVLFQGKYCAVNYAPMKPLSYEPDYLIKELPKGKIFRKAMKEFTPVEIALGLKAARTRFGYCVPSTCSMEDATKFSTFLNEYFHVNGTVAWCHTKEDVSLIGPLQIGILSGIGAISVLVIIASYLDYTNTGKQQEKISQITELFLSISAFKTYERLSKKEVFDPRFTFLYGFRFLSLLWILYAHTYALQNILSVGNTIKLRDVPQEFFFQLFMNGTLAAESFFFMSGFIVSLFMVNVLKLRDNTSSGVGIKFWTNFLSCYISRIWRQTPVLFFVIGIAIIWPIVGSGPIWRETLDVMSVNCRHNFLPTVAFFSNFEKPTEMVSAMNLYLSVARRNDFGVMRRFTCE
jgi:hypothetical protein